MKNIVLLGFLFVLVHINAQTDLEKLQNDIVNYTYDYSNPASELSVNIAQITWANTATVLKKGKFSIAAVGNYMFVNNSNKTRLLKASDLEILTIEGGQASINVPTILGGSSDIRLVADADLLGNGTITNVAFNVPAGMDKKSLKSYIFQGNVGLGFHTELKLRYVPKTKIDEVINKGYGFGLQHNVSRWFSGLEDKRIDLALLVSYANFNISNDIVLDIQGEDINRANADGTTMNYELLASKKYDRLTISTGVSLLTNKYTLLFEGQDSFLLQVLNEGLTSKNQSNSSFKANLGVSYKYEHFDFFTSFSYSNFSNISVGINYNL